jgi:hypothetical protein
MFCLSLFRHSISPGMNFTIGDHPRLFSADDLASVIAWIKTGALEK